MEVGPVDVKAARCWLAHVRPSLAAVRRQQDRLPFRLPPEVADDIDELLGQWSDAADAVAAGGGDEFHWVGLLEEERVRTLVRYWANLDSMSDELVRDLGVDWSPPDGRPFFAALTTAVAEALATAELGPDPFAELLVERNEDPPRSVRSA